MDIGLNSIYRATEGEGIRIGTPQIFVRLQGCSIGCVNCDSKDTWKFESMPKVSLQSVCQQVDELATSGRTPVKWISITGGDPLHPSHVPAVIALIDKLQDRYSINIEASGTRIVPEIFERVDYISFDYKTPSTAVKTNPELILQLARQYAGKFQIKSVAADVVDFNACYSALQELENILGEINFEWCLTPAYDRGVAFPAQQFQAIMALNEDHGGPFRVIGQQHKWVYGPNRTNV